ncbi:hypothetical protein ABFX02_05G034300 [Erythranthe guttata]
MNTKGRINNPKSKKLYDELSDNKSDHEELRRGPWTLEEDNLLIQYIRSHGEGSWNSSARFAGLKRTGKSCRLRWLNYLKPDIKRGNLSLQEQLLILELHSKWGNRWSKIAQHLPGRTDNEIKNYWRTRVQKQARQLKVDSNSKKFLEAIRMFWMPRLLEKMQQDTSSSSSSIEIQKHAAEAEAPPPFSPVSKQPTTTTTTTNNNNNNINIIINSEDDSNSLFEDNNYYVGFPNYETMMEELELEEAAQGNTLLCGRHVLQNDWFGEEDLGSSTTASFWNTDELWQNSKGWNPQPTI